MAKFIITGGTGLIGTQLCKKLLTAQHDVYLLTTQKAVKHPLSGIEYVYWNPAENYIEPAFKLHDCVIMNLAGAGVSEKRWTDKRKQEIVSSRINSLHTLYHAVKTGQFTCQQLLSASAIGYYGNTMKKLSESDAPDNSFLSQTCVQWEAATRPFLELGIAVHIVRIGIVLSSEGAALRELTKPLQWGIAAIPGDGRQIMSWIHIDDLCCMMLFLLESKKEGIYNGTANYPVSANRLFDEIEKYKKGMRVHIPGWILKVVLGEMHDEVMKSADVSNSRIREAGFTFRYPDIEAAIANLLKEI